MNQASSLKWLYATGIAFVAACIVALIFDFPYVLGLPLLIAAGFLFVYKTKYLFYFLAFATPLSVHLVEERVSTINLSLPTEPIIILLFVAVILKLLQLKSFRLPELKTLLSILIITDLGWLLFTSLTSTMPLISFKYLLSKTWYVVVFYFLFSRFFSNPKHVKIFLWCLTVSTCILALYTLYNHSLGSFTRTYAYTAMRPFLPDHGMYAAAISFMAPVMLIFGIYSRKLGYNRIIQVISFGFFAFLAVAIALSFTRASWVSIAAALGVYVVLLLRIKFKYLLVGGLLILGAITWNLDDLLTDMSRNKNESDDDIENHLQSVSNVSSDPSNLERLNRWSCVFRMWEDKPILGFGPGTFTFQYGSYQIPHQMTIISTTAGDQGGVHSEYLRPLAESGFMGTILILSLVIVSFSMGFRQYYELTGVDRYLALAVFLGLVTYFTHGVLNNYSEFDKIAVPLYSFLAVQCAMEVKRSNEKQILQK